MPLSIRTSTPPGSKRSYAVCMRSNPARWGLSLGKRSSRRDVHCCMASKALRFHPQEEQEYLTALSSYVMGIASAVQLRQSILKTPLVRRSKKSEKLRSAGRSTSWISENILSGNFPSALCIRSFLLGSWSLRWLTGEGSPDIGGIVFEANVPSVPDSPVPESPPPNKISNPAAAPSLSLRFLQGQGGNLTCHPQPMEMKSPPCRKGRDKSGAPGPWG